MPKHNKKTKTPAKAKVTKRAKPAERPKKTSTMKFPGRSW
jgi:hypothetical protein